MNFAMIERRVAETECLAITAAIQIFDQEGNVIAEWRQFGWPNGMYIDQKDTLYVSNSASNPKNNSNAKPTGIYIGNAKDGTVTAYVPYEGGRGGESIAADADGNLYLGSRGVVKYVKQ